MIYICKSIIERGNCDAEEMRDKLDVFLLANRITQEQYKELTALITA